MAGRDLTPKQQAFVNEYLIDGNGKQAAIRAGYAPAGAEVQASRLLRHVKVEALLRARREELQERTSVTVERVIEELALIAFSDLRDVAAWSDAGIALIDSAEIPEAAARALREVVSTTTATEHGESTRTHVKLHDKMRALELIGKQYGMFKEKVDVSVSGGLTLSALTRLARPELGE